MSADEPIIVVRGLVKRFGDQTVLDGVDLDVRQGETMVIMGGSGSGKSTLLRHLIGSLVPDSGSVHILGQDLSRVDEDGLNKLRKRFGILFQSGALFNSMTIAENVALPLQEHTILASNIIEIQVKIKLELVGLREPAELLLHLAGVVARDLDVHSTAASSGPGCAERTRSDVPRLESRRSAVLGRSRAGPDARRS